MSKQLLQYPVIKTGITKSSMPERFTAGYRIALEQIDGQVLYFKDESACSTAMTTHSFTVVPVDEMNKYRIELGYIRKP